MSIKTSNGALLGILLVLLVIAVISKTFKSAPKISPEVILTTSTESVVKHSNTLASIYKDIQKVQAENKLDLIIRNGKLTNPILGQTTVNLNEEGKIVCVITMDVEKAEAAGDKVEPLLGHELKHVWDALFLYDTKDPYVSAAKFIEAANVGKKNLYKDREVESSAIGVENTIRKELILSEDPEFSNLPKTRDAADMMYANKSKINSSLKSKLINM